MFFMLTLGSTKKSCVAQKTVVSNKENVKVNVAQQNYVSHQKNMLWQQKNYVTPKRRLKLLKLTKCLVLHRKGMRVYKKNGSCCI